MTFPQKQVILLGVASGDRVGDLCLNPVPRAIGIVKAHVPAQAMAK